MAGTAWPNLTAGQKARASDVESKFDWLEGHIVPMLGGSTTTGVYDLGTSTAAWRFLHMHPTGGIQCSGATSMAFLADGTVKLKNGVGVNEFSSDDTLAGDSDLAVPTEKAVKTYIDGRVNPPLIIAYAENQTLSSIGILEYGIVWSVSSDPFNSFTNSSFTPWTNGTYEIDVNVGISVPATASSGLSNGRLLIKTAGIGTDAIGMDLRPVGDFATTMKFHATMSLTTSDTITTYLSIYSSLATSQYTIVKLGVVFENTTTAFSTPRATWMRIRKI